MDQQAPHQGGSRFAAAVRRAQQHARVASSHVGLPAHPSNALPRSGVQPDAAGQVLCPFCHKTFPFSAVLLNRQLRCSGCRSTFRVAEDRRTFRVQAAANLPGPEVGTASHMARSAIRQANASLNEAAAAALRALGKQDRPAPPGSETALVAAVHTPAPATRTITRRKRDAALTGEGLAAGRRRRAMLLAVGCVLALAALAAWTTAPNARMLALRDFQHGMSFATLARDQRANRLGAGIEPVIGLEGASLGRTRRVALDKLGAAVAGMRILARGQIMVERSRHGEATSLLGDGNLDDPATRRQFLERCAKAGIRTAGWSELLAAAEIGQEAEAIGVLRAILLQPVTAEPVFDALAQLDTTGLPERIEVCRFQGLDGSLLQGSGSPRHPVPYHGRLLRFTGDGWPDAWMVFELRCGTRTP